MLRYGILDIDFEVDDSSISKGLIAKYTFDVDGHSDINTDNNFSIYNNPDYVSGKINNCISFTKDPCEYGLTLASPFVGSTPFSISVWVKPTFIDLSTNTYTIIRTQDSLNDEFDPVKIVYNRFILSIDSNGLITNACMKGGFIDEGMTHVFYTANYSDPSIFDGNWHHIVSTVISASDGIKTYYDGNLVSTGNLVSNVDFTYTYKLFLGAFETLSTMGNEKFINWYRGEIDEMYIYNRILTNKEVLLLYNYTG